MTTDPGPEETRGHKAERHEAEAAERGAKADRRTERRRAERARAIREWVILGLSVVVAAVVLLQQHHTSTVTACQARYNNAFAADLTARAALTDEDHQATTGLIEGVFSPPAGQGQAERRAYFEELFATYSREQARITEARKAHPFPQLPSKACR